MFDISSGTILDVAIGLTLMYLMISLVATAVNEMFATVIKLRPKYLVKAMESILDNESLKKAFYDSGVISSVQDAIGQHPSYISSPNFALALINSLDTSKPLPVFAEVLQSVQKLPDSNIRDILLAQISVANGDMEKLRGGLADWFDSAMDRVSGLYKRDLKYISIGVGIFIAALLNADSISVTRALWQDPKLRDAMVLAAENQLKNRGAQAQHQATVEPGPDQNENADQKNNVDPFKDLRETYDNANATLKPLPIG
jgi:hypothetical protein